MTVVVMMMLIIVMSAESAPMMVLSFVDMAVSIVVMVFCSSDCRVSCDIDCAYCFFYSPERPFMHFPVCCWFLISSEIEPVRGRAGPALNAVQ